jgi:hypothetical protein
MTDPLRFQVIVVLPERHLNERVGKVCFASLLLREPDLV